MEPGGFSVPHILLTAVVAAVVAYGLLRLFARELRGRDDVGVAAHVGLATFALRFFGNIPVLNDDIFSVCPVRNIITPPVRGTERKN